HRLQVALRDVGDLQGPEARKDPQTKVRFEARARARPPAPRILGPEPLRGELGDRVTHPTPRALGLRVDALMDLAEHGLRAFPRLRERQVRIGADLVAALLSIEHVADGPRLPPAGLDAQH